MFTAVFFAEFIDLRSWWIVDMMSKRKVLLDFDQNVVSKRQLVVSEDVRDQVMVQKSDNMVAKDTNDMVSKEGENVATKDEDMKEFDEIVVSANSGMITIDDGMLSVDENMIAVEDMISVQKAMGSIEEIIASYDYNMEDKDEPMVSRHNSDTVSVDEAVGSMEGDMRPKSYEDKDEGMTSMDIDVTLMDEGVSTVEPMLVDDPTESMSKIISSEDKTTEVEDQVMISKDDAVTSTDESMESVDKIMTTKEKAMEVEEQDVIPRNDAMEIKDDSTGSINMEQADEPMISIDENEQIGRAKI